MTGATSRAARAAPWVGGTLLLLVAGVALYLFTGAAASKPSNAPPPQTDDISYGAPQAELAVIEYSDFQCPFCAVYAPIMKSLREDYGDRVRFVFRFFPLKNHAYGMISAQAAYAAHLQGRFWEMHDLLFERQDEWSGASDPVPYFESYAESLGMDLTRFRADLSAQATIDVIEGQRAAGDRAGVTHTPWFVVGDSVVLPRTLRQFEKLIEERL